MDPLKIITKTGDDGFTRSVDGEKVFKNHPKVAAVGKIDTLCAYMGVTINFTDKHLVRTLLSDVSKHLVLIMGELSNFGTKEYKYDTLSMDHLDKLEAWCSDISDILKVNDFNMNDWIVYGLDGQLSAHLDYCSKLAREAEVNSVTISSNLIRKYMNRLSDFFFLLARSCSEKFN